MYVCVCVYGCRLVGNENVCLSIYTGQPGNNIEVNQRTVKKERFCHQKRGED